MVWIGEATHMGDLWNTDHRVQNTSTPSGVSIRQWFRQQLGSSIIRVMIGYYRSLFKIIRLTLHYSDVCGPLYRVLN